MSTPSPDQGDIAARKGQHIDLCRNPESQGDTNPFPGVELPYTALPDFNLDDVDTSTKLLGKELSQPLIISSMTGGTEHGSTINTNLAIAAEAGHVALGVGSQRIAVEREGAVETFKNIRRLAPTAFLFANMGAIQLNNGYGVDEYQRVVDMIEADALYLHLNPLQEALQPGGDTNYAGLAPKIVKLIRAMDIPVFIKEVGHGIDLATAELLIDAGAAGIDVAGVGGTSYAWVEAKRADNDDFAHWFKSIGTPTEKAVRDIAPVKGDSLLIASGGVRSPIDGLKGHLIGADLYASTQPFLDAALESSDVVLSAIENWRRGLQVAMFASGHQRWNNPTA